MTGRRADGRGATAQPEEPLVAADGEDELTGTLDREIYACNVAATGHAVTMRSAS
jgi:hypothetical protein